MLEFLVCHWRLWSAGWLGWLLRRCCAVSCLAPFLLQAVCVVGAAIVVAADAVVPAANVLPFVPPLALCAGCSGGRCLVDM